MIVCGWLCYLIALACPAVDYFQLGIDSYRQETKTGAYCFCATFDIMNWLLFPIFALYGLANLFMVLSVFLARSSPDARLIAAAFFLAFFLVALAAPWSAREVHGVLVGCVLWQLSFLAVGLGLIWLANTDKRI